MGTGTVETPFKRKEFSGSHAIFPKIKQIDKEEFMKIRK